MRAHGLRWLAGLQVDLVDVAAGVGGGDEEVLSGELEALGGGDSGDGPGELHAGGVGDVELVDGALVVAADVGGVGEEGDG